MSAGARFALIVLAGLLVAILAVLVAFGVVLRRRAKREREGSDAGLGEDESELAVGAYLAAEEVLDAAEFRSSGAAGLGGLGVVGGPERSEAQVCPTCRREYDPDMEYCPHDARRLVGARDLRGRRGGTICASCHRSYDHGVRFCAHDASELIPVAVYRATARATARSGRRMTAKATGIIAKICPRCQRRYDLSATFCGKDSSELVVLH